MEIKYKNIKNSDYVVIKNQLEKELEDNKVSIEDIENKFSNEVKLFANEFNVAGKLSENNIKRLRVVSKILNLYKELNNKELELISDEVLEFKKTNKQLEDCSIVNRSLSFNNEQLQLEIKKLLQDEDTVQEKVNLNNNILKENKELFNEQLEQINKALGNINNKYNDVHIERIPSVVGEDELNSIIKKINNFSNKYENLKNVSNSITRAINSTIVTIKNISESKKLLTDLSDEVLNISKSKSDLVEKIKLNKIQIEYNDEFVKKNQKINLDDVEKKKTSTMLNNKKNDFLVYEATKLLNEFDTKKNNVSNILNKRFDINFQKKQGSFKENKKNEVSVTPLKYSTFGEYEEKEESKNITDYMKKWYNYLDDLLDKPEEEFVIDKNNITNFKLVFRNSKTGLSTFKESIVQLNHSISSKTSPVFQLGSNTYKAVSQGVRLLAGTIVINAFKNVPFVYLHSISNSKNASIEKIPPLDLYIIPIENLSDGRFEALLIKNIKFTDLRQTDGASSGGRYYAANFIAQNFIPIDFSTVNDFSFFEKN